MWRSRAFPQAVKDWHDVNEQNALSAGQELGGGNDGRRGVKKVKHPHPPCPYCRGLNIYPDGGAAHGKSASREPDLRKMRPKFKCLDCLGKWKQLPFRLRGQ